MAFLAPLIGAALGLGTVGTALVSLGLGVGLSFVSNKLKPKQKSGASASGAPVGLNIDTDPPRQVILGKVATGGSVVFWHVSGTNSDKLWLVIALADHECTALDAVIVDKKQKSWDAGTGNVADYGGKLKVRFYSGAAGQVADSALAAASGGRWTSTCVGASVCYVVVEADYDEKLFPGGVPELGFVLRGAKLYDPRTATTAYSDNAAVAVYNVLRGMTVGGQKLLGLNVPATAIRQADAEAACNACDEAVSLAAGGTEARYRVGIVLDCDRSNRDILETLIGAMAGEVIETGGIYRIMAGVSQSPVANLTDADLIVTEPLVVRPKRGRDRIVNAVYGSYTDPARLYSQVPLPPRTSSTDESADGGLRLSTNIDLVAVTSRAQAQRVCEIERRRARLQGEAQMQLRARWSVLEPGDWVTVTSDRRGLVSALYQVESLSGLSDLRTDVALTQADADVDYWDTSLEIADNQVVDLASGAPSYSAVAGIVLANVTIAGAGTQQRPGLRITWTPTTDPTVIALLLEYRKVGDTVAVERRIHDASAGEYTWLDAVQGGIEYEARLRPVTLPERTTTWSSWVSPGANAPNQIVAAAEIAAAVPPDTITPEMLSAQARFELSLITATDSVLGSLSEAMRQTRDEVEAVSQAAINATLDNLENRAQIRVEQRLRIEEDLSLAQQITTAVANFNSTSAIVQNQITALSAVDQALASDITTVASELAGQTATVTVIQQSINGIEAKFGVAVSAGGEVLGIVQLEGDAVAGSTFTVVVDNFRVAAPGVGGGAAIPVFAIQNVNGVAKIALRGDMYADGTITANKLSVSQLSALSADLGTVIAGLIRNAANTIRFDLPNMRIYRTDNTMEVDWLNKRIRIVF